MQWPDSFTMTLGLPTWRSTDRHGDLGQYGGRCRLVNVSSETAPIFLRACELNSADACCIGELDVEGIGQAEGVTPRPRSG
jgi:hypothetical protein